VTKLVPAALLVASVIAAAGCRPRNDFQVHMGLGDALYANKQYAKAVVEFGHAIRLNPSFAEAHRMRAECYAALNEFDKAIAGYGDAIRLDPAGADAHNALAWTLATCPVDRYRDGATALTHAKRAYALDADPLHMGTLGAACAEVGEFAEAIGWQEKANSHPKYPEGAFKTGLKRIKLYQQKKPYRDEINEYYIRR
jgi:tetratricopeptide (TPR) repeat protein